MYFYASIIAVYYVSTIYFGKNGFFDFHEKFTIFLQFLKLKNFKTWVKEISEVEDHTEAVPVMVAEVEVEVVAATIAIKMGTCLGNVPKADLEAEDVAVADSEVIFYILIYSIIISKNSSIIHKYFFAKIFHSSSIF